MIVVGSFEKTDLGDRTRFASNISINSEGRELYFDVPSDYANYVVDDRCDALVGCLLYVAVALGQDITSNVPISARFARSLELHLIPHLAHILGKRPIRLRIPVDESPIPTLGKVGTGYSRGVDSFYTVMTHTSGVSYRPKLTHLVVLNNGVFEGDNAEGIAMDLYRDAQGLADEISLEALYISSNVQDILPESFLEVVALRNMSCILLLQRLFSVYLYSSGHGFEDFEYRRESTGEQELYLTQCFSTSTLRFYNAGAGVRRRDKIEALVEYPPCYQRLHPCFVEWDRNCGHCRKCRRDTVALIALGALDKFDKVYDVEFARKNFDVNVAFLMANASKPLYKEVLDLVEERGVPISARSRVLASYFEKGMERLKDDLGK